MKPDAHGKAAVFGSWSSRALVVTLLAASGATGGTSAAAIEAAPAARLAAICPVVDRAAAVNRLPAELLARILWQESRFHSHAISPAGAEGVAQFLPLTAAEHRLDNPNDPASAIAAAAQMLGRLAARFGNVGLAAAAYNAGSGRIAKWLRAEADLPSETREYVVAVTGRRIEDWARASGGTPAFAGGSGDNTCLQAIARIVRSVPTPVARPLWQIRLDDSLASASRLIGRPTRRRADGRQSRQAQAFCAQIRVLGAACAVYGP